MISLTISNSAIAQFSLITLIIMGTSQAMEAPESGGNKRTQAPSSQNEKKDWLRRDQSFWGDFFEGEALEALCAFADKEEEKFSIDKGFPSCETNTFLQDSPPPSARPALLNDTLSPKRSIADTISDDSDLGICWDEASENKQSLQSNRKRLKKGKAKRWPNFSINEFMGMPEEYARPRLISSSFASEIKDDSDEENRGEDVCHYSAKPLPGLTPVIDMGTKLKLLANVYLGKIDHLANIFLPQYVVEVEQSDKKIRKEKPRFFTTLKGEICVFASGGTQNAWEKTVAKVYEIFFGQKVKIIRSRWMQKHLTLTKNLTKEFDISEKELHSEFYYDLFFIHFFFPYLGDRYGNSVKGLTINAFSWWEICDSCNNNYLIEHKNLCSQQGIRGPIFNISAARKYVHRYPPSTTIRGYRVPETQEKEAWNEIWQKLKIYVDKYPDNTDEKQKFWTRTPEGLELCKWLGQAFVENTRSLDGKAVSPKRKGDILKFYNEMMEKDTGDLKNLILYLREENWDLSCWYKRPSYPKQIQDNWKKHALQIVMPHFDWKFLREFEVEYGDAQCEMCGNEGVRYMSMVYHPKHQVTKKLLELTEEEERLDWSFTGETPFNELSETMKKKRRQSLAVGSECVKFLQVDREEVNDWRDDHPEAELEARLQSLHKREEHNEAVDIAEANELYKWMCRQLSSGKSPLTRRYILKHSSCGEAKELNPLIKILLQSNKIQEVKKGSYIVKESRDRNTKTTPASQRELFQAEQNQKSSKSSSSDKEVEVIYLD